jgi:hypothetical protein
LHLKNEEAQVGLKVELKQSIAVGTKGCSLVHETRETKPEGRSQQGESQVEPEGRS